MVRRFELIPNHCLDSEQTQKASEPHTKGIDRTLSPQDPRSAQITKIGANTNRVCTKQWQNSTHVQQNLTRDEKTDEVKKWKLGQRLKNEQGFFKKTKTQRKEAKDENNDQTLLVG